MPTSRSPATFTAFISTLGLAVGGVAGASEVRRAEPFVGVLQHQFIQTLDDLKSPRFARPVVVNVLEIDTKAPGIRFQMSPGNGDGPGEVTRGTTRAFVDRVGAQIGINVGFYDTKANYGGLNTDLMHLAASDGDVFSAARGGEWAVDVSKANVPRIARADDKDSKTVGKGTGVYNAAGGNQPMLRDGEVVTPPDDKYTTTLNPHTAIGVSKDRTKIYLATVDGRQVGYSEGMRTDELAAVMRRFGCSDAINFDGGGSTTMVMDDSDDAKADARLVNSPSDNSSPTKPGTERVVANSFAVFAKWNPKYVPLPPVTRPKAEPGLELLTTRTILDDFEAGRGHFSGPVLASGSTTGVDATSCTTLDPTVAHDGKSSLKLSIVADAKRDDFQLRLLSGDATPKANAIDNKAMGNDGFVGVWLKRDAGQDPLFVSMAIDDGTPNVVGTERGQSFEVTPDGRWHLYQWGLNEDAKWTTFNGGNGKIDGPNVFVDSLIFRTAKGDEKGGGAFGGTVWIDGVTYEPAGRIDGR